MVLKINLDCKYEVEYMISKEKGDLSKFQVSLIPFFGLANDG